MVKMEDRLEELWNKALTRYIENSDHERIIEMLDEQDLYEYRSLYDDVCLNEYKTCVFGCGKELDPDEDYENSCKKCE